MSSSQSRSAQPHRYRPSTSTSSSTQRSEQIARTGRAAATLMTRLELSVLKRKIEQLDSNVDKILECTSEMNDAGVKQQEQLHLLNKTFASTSILFMSKIAQVATTVETLSGSLANLDGRIKQLSGAFDELSARVHKLEEYASITPGELTTKSTNKPPTKSSR